jgi:hypothetical protein
MRVRRLRAQRENAATAKNPPWHIRSRGDSPHPVDKTLTRTRWIPEQSANFGITRRVNLAAGEILLPFETGSAQVPIRREAEKESGCATMGTNRGIYQLDDYYWRREEMRMRSVSKLLLAVFVFFLAIRANSAEPEHKTVSFSLTTAKQGERRTFVGAEGKLNGVVNPNLVVMEWDVVEVTLTNGDNLNHHIAIPDFFIMSEVVSEKGKKTTITFVPFKKGEFVYYCILENHRKLGMEGNLVVTSS